MEYLSVLILLALLIGVGVINYKESKKTAERLIEPFIKSL
jgi:hypothetical protein